MQGFYAPVDLGTGSAWIRRWRRRLVFNNGLKGSPCTVANHYKTSGARIGTTELVYVSIQTLARQIMGQATFAAGQRVLIVDDDEDVLEVAAMLVRDLGYCVVTARSGADALRLLKRDRTVSVLFSDIVMPGMDGETLARLALAVRPGLQVILASGARRPTAKVAFVQKPYRAVDLISVLPRFPRCRAADGI